MPEFIGVIIAVDHIISDNPYKYTWPCSTSFTKVSMATKQQYKGIVLCTTRSILLHIYNVKIVSKENINLLIRGPCSFTITGPCCGHLHLMNCSFDNVYRIREYMIVYNCDGHFPDQCSFFFAFPYIMTIHN